MKTRRVTVYCAEAGEIRNVSAFAAYGHYLSQTRFDVEVSVVSEGTLHCAKEKNKYRTPRNRKIRGTAPYRAAGR